MIVSRAIAVALLAAIAPVPAALYAAVPSPAALADVDKIFAEWQLAAHVPGLVYGIVVDGRLVHVRGLGVQDVETRAPVTPDTLFRIASMSKAFTALAILKLRDEGKVSLDAPAELYVPELRGWKCPTSDSPRITVRNLLTHSAGFVEDNPWGDRQQVLTEPEFSWRSVAAQFARGTVACQKRCACRSFAADRRRSRLSLSCSTGSVAVG